MPQSLSQILVHIVFSTKSRRPFLHDRTLREQLHSVLGGIVNRLDCQSLIVGGVADHVHLLVDLSRTRTAADLVKEIKRGSTTWLKTQRPDLAEFAWQTGYGIFSIGASQVPTVRRYIVNQEAHHHSMSYQDEFRQLLARYRVPFDERYVWD
jgi:putative transposase